MTIGYRDGAGAASVLNQLLVNCKFRQHVLPIGEVSDVTQETPERVSRQALASLAVGILALVLLWAFGAPTLVTAFGVGLGHLALQDIKRSKTRGAVLAWVGLILGYGLTLMSIIRFIPSAINGLS